MVEGDAGQANPSFYNLLAESGGGGRARGRGFEEVEESFESGESRSAAALGRTRGQ